MYTSPYVYKCTTTKSEIYNYINSKVLNYVTSDVH